MPIITPASEIVQGSEKWLALRAGIPTASEFHNFMGPPRGSKSFLDKFNLKEPGSKEAKEAGELNDAVWSYVCLKVAERFSGGPMLDAQFNSFVTDQGKLNEKLARKWLAAECDQDVEEVAFIKTDDGRAGCSPDGLLGDSEGAEIKCPQMPKQVKYCLEGVLPEDYVHQVYGSLFVSGRQRWHFVSFFDGFPALHLVIEREEAIMQRIGKSIATLSSLIDGAYAELVKKP